MEIQGNRDSPYYIELGTFSGPLDLLLYLIKKHKIDIFDIPIAFITEKYLEYLKVMEEVNLNIASEYMEMAATLIYLKSKMLLPVKKREEMIEEEDPRSFLVERLLIYQKIKEVSLFLWEKENILGRDIFKRKAIDINISKELAPLSTQDLILAWDRIINRRRLPPSSLIRLKRINLVDRMNQLLKKLKSNMLITFSDLIELPNDRELIVVTFLALLELVKLRIIKMVQHRICGELFIIKISETEEYYRGEGGKMEHRVV